MRATGLAWLTDLADLPLFPPVMVAKFTGDYISKEGIYESTLSLLLIGRCTLTLSARSVDQPPQLPLPEQQGRLPPRHGSRSTRHDAFT